MSILDIYKELLTEFVAFPSISTDSSFQPEIKKTAQWVADLLKGYGFEVESWNNQGLNPVIYAHYQVANPDAQTVLVYGHYDVQPAANSDGWHSDPFRLTERKDRLYARGVVDNKGQILIHITTIGELIASGKLAHNVIFLIEGDEETGSAGLGAVLEAHRNELNCDYVLISDGEIPYRPTIEASLRGSFNMRIRYRTAKTNLHSGIYGGGIPNAAQELSHLIASLYDKHQRIAVPGFYDDVDTITADQQAAAKALYVGDARLQEITGVKSPLHDNAHDYGVATSLLPSLEVSGIESGYTGEGFSNIIPATAEARLNIRIVASQDTKKVFAAMQTYIHRKTPSYVSCEVEMDISCEPIKLATDSPIAQHAQRLLSQAYGKQPLFSYCGASIPIVSEFKDVLGKDCLLVSLGNDDCNMHGLDENFELNLLQKGLDFSRLFFSQPLS